MSTPHQPGPADKQVFSSIVELLEEQGRPLAIGDFADLLSLPIEVIRRVVENAHHHGRLDRVDDTYMLPQGGAR